MRSNILQTLLAGLVLFLFAVSVDSAAVKPAPPKPCLPKPSKSTCTSTMSKPTMVSFAGAFHQKEHLKYVNPKIQAKGYTVISETLGTVNNRALSIKDDVEQMHRIMLPLFAQGKNVVLTIHSYAGMPGSAAIKGLSKAERASKGLPGGIIGVVYLCAFIPPEGASLKDLIGGDFAPWQSPDFDAGLVRVEKPIPVFYNDVPDPIAQEATRIFLPQSLVSFTDKSGPIGYQDAGYKGRIAYIRGEFDQAIPAVGQDAMMSASGVNFTVERFQTGHSPFLSHPDLLADTLDKLAKSFVAKI